MIRLTPNPVKGTATSGRRPLASNVGQLADTVKRAIDSEHGRWLYSQRIGTVEPVFANLRYNKRLTRFTLRSRSKVRTQWSLYCLVHNIEKLASAA